MRERIIVLINQASHVLERGRTLFVRCQKKLKHPARLPNEAEVGEVASLALLVGGCQNGHECGFAIEAHAPAVGCGVLGDVAWPRLWVDLSQ